MEKEKKTKRIEIRVTEKEYEKMTYLRRKTGLTAGDIFRKGFEYCWNLRR